MKTKDFVKVVVKVQNGHVSDARVHFRAVDGTWKLTKKNIALNSAVINEILRTVDAAWSELNFQNNSRR